MKQLPAKKSPLCFSRHRGLRRHMTLPRIALCACALAGWSWAQPAAAIPTHGGVNTLLGDPRNGTREDADGGIVGDGIAHTTPDGVTTVAGQVPGHTKSIIAGNTGINIMQPLIASAGAGDPRFDDVNPLTGTTAWETRIGGAVQWQLNQNGAVTPILPLGSASGQFYSLTGRTTEAVVVGVDGSGAPAFALPADNGGGPGAAAADGVQDQVLWVLDPLSGRLVTGFGKTFFDTASATAAGLPLSEFVGRIDLFEDGALYSSIAAQDERNFDHTGGTNGLGGDELNDAVDGTLLLTGTLENVFAEYRWTADLASVLPGQDGQLGTADDVFVAEPISIRQTVDLLGDIVYDGGSMFGDLVTTGGNFSASWRDLPYNNTTGTDGDGLYDYLGDSLSDYSSQQTFELAAGPPAQVTPEPSTLILAGLSLLGLCMTRRRRRR